MNLKEKIEKSIEILKSNNFEEITLQFNNPVDSQLLQKVEQQFPYFPEVLKEIYKQFDGFKFSWYFENQNIVLSPNISFSSLNFLLGGTTNLWNNNAFEDILWFQDTDDIKFIESVKKLKILEHNSSINTFTLIDLNKFDNPLYIFNNSKLIALEIKIEQYIDLLCQTRGISYWQYLYTSNLDNNLRDQVIKNFENMPIVI